MLNLGKAVFCLVAAMLAAWVGFAFYFVVLMADFDEGKPKLTDLLMVGLSVTCGLIAISGAVLFAVRALKGWREPPISDSAA